VERLNLPNLITLLRVILVPVVFWLLITDQTQLAFVLFIVAGISDAVDGYLAKTFGWQTELGAYLDPLADKLLIVSIFLALGVDGKLPLWLVVAVVSRDILIVIAVILSWLLSNPVRIRPLIVSKANTVAQIILAGTVLADEGFSRVRSPSHPWLPICTVGCYTCPVMNRRAGAAELTWRQPCAGTMTGGPKRCASNVRCCSG